MPTYEIFRPYVGVRCIRSASVLHKLGVRYNTLTYVVVRRVRPEILCMHKISNVCRRTDNTLTHKLGVRNEYVMHKFMNVTCKLLIRSHTLPYAKAHLDFCIAREKRMRNALPTYEQRA